MTTLSFQPEHSITQTTTLPFSHHTKTSFKKSQYDQINVLANLGNTNLHAQQSNTLLPVLMWLVQSEIDVKLHFAQDERIVFVFENARDKKLFEEICASDVRG